MIEHNLETDEKHLYCDRCNKELENEVIVMSSGDVVCNDCFSKEYNRMTKEEYFTEE